ncbi:MAG: TetR/AcrR family transcriptional regulator [Trebonia sp.]
MTARKLDRQLSTADERRETVLRTAVRAFAARGYYGTPTVDIAREAGISQSYLYRLFPAKEDLFVAVIERCFQLVRESFADGAAKAASAEPAAVLAVMGDAYARLISDPDLLLLQLQAQCAAHEPAIGEAVRSGYARLVEYVRAASGGTDAQIQEFFARGMLCHLVVAVGAASVDARWARTLGEGIVHYEAASG